LKAQKPCPAGSIPAGFFVLRELRAKSRGFAPIRAMLQGSNIAKPLKYLHYY
jgi:hypothetical protein